MLESKRYRYCLPPEKFKGSCRPAETLNSFQCSVVSLLSATAAGAVTPQWQLNWPQQACGPEVTCTGFYTGLANNVAQVFGIQLVGYEGGQGWNDACAGGSNTTYCGNPGAQGTVSSGTYNSGTGVVSLALSSALNLSPGLQISVNVSGTGAVASANGIVTAGAGTSGSTLNYTIATGLTMAIGSGMIYTDVAQETFQLNFELSGQMGQANTAWLDGQKANGMINLFQLGDTGPWLTTNNLLGQTNYFPFNPGTYASNTPTLRQNAIYAWILANPCWWSGCTIH